MTTMNKNMQEPEIVYLLFGSNLGDRSGYIQEAIAKVKERVGELFVISSVYETEPWGFRHKTPFLNQAAGLYTHASPHKLLGEIMILERESGRMRKGMDMRHAVWISISCFTDAMSSASITW